MSLFYLRNNIDKIEKELSATGSSSPEDIVSTSTELPKPELGDGPVLNNVPSKMASMTDQSFISFIENTESSSTSSSSLSDEPAVTSMKNPTPEFLSMQRHEINTVPSWMLMHPLSILPPDDTIYKLLDVFLNICETNFFYIHPQKFPAELDKFLKMKRKGDMASIGKNWKFLVILLGVLSIAVCYEYIQNGDGIPQEHLNNSWEDPGYPYYVCILPFAGFLLNNNDVGSLQVFQLIGAYLTTKKIDILSVSIDHGYRYIFLALEIAMSNNLHLSETYKDMNEEDKEFRKRLWWSCYTLEKRLGFNLGKSELIKSEDITVELPKDVPALRHKNGTSNCYHQKSLVELVNIFGKLSTLVYIQPSRRGNNDNLLSIQSKTIRMISQELDNWKDNLPITCRWENFDPSDYFYRANNHLRLFYYLGKIYLGKPFLLYQVENYERISQQANKEESVFIHHLTSVCVDAAYNTFEILSAMQNNGRLGIYSSTDLNFCNLSLFVIIAFLKLDQSESTKMFLKKGLQLLSTLSRGCSSARVNLSRFKKLEKILAQESGSDTQYPKSHYSIDNTLTVLPDMDIDIYAQNFQLAGMGSMVLPDAITGHNMSQNAMRDDPNDYQFSDDFLVNFFSHDLNWIKNIDVDKFK